MLEVRNLSVFYGRHRAVERASAKISMGEIVVMLGSNGAGKSTFLRAIAGQTRAMPESAVVMDGVDITHRPPHEIVETGIALVPEDRGVFADLTVHENLDSRRASEAGARRRGDEHGARADIVSAGSPNDAGSWCGP